MKGETLLDRVQKVLNSDITGYEIEKYTHITRVSIGRYRNGHTPVANMTLDTAMKLEKFGRSRGMYDEDTTTNDEEETD